MSAPAKPAIVSLPAEPVRGRAITGVCRLAGLMKEGGQAGLALFNQTEAAADTWGQSCARASVPCHAPGEGRRVPVPNELLGRLQHLSRRDDRRGEALESRLREQVTLDQAHSEILQRREFVGRLDALAERGDPQFLQQP